MNKQEKALLAELYAEEYGASYGTELMKDVDALVVLHDGYAITRQKVKVESTLYVGYHTENYDETMKRCDTEDKAEAFMRYNLRNFDYEWNIEKNDRFDMWLVAGFDGKKLSYLAYGDEWTVRHQNGGHIEKFTEADYEAYTEAYKVARERFEKKCRNWLKRYGTDRVFYHTYWADE